MCSPERKIQSFEFFNLSILFLLFTFCRGYVSCALSDRNSKASKKLPSLLRGLRHLLQILVQGHRVILFLKGNTQKRIYPPYFFKSLLFDIFTQNPALICLTNSLLWKLHSHPSVLPICTNWTDDNIWGSKLCKLTKQILTCKHSYFFSFFLNLLLWQMSITEEQAKDFLDSCTIVLAHQSILIWI